MRSKGLAVLAIVFLTCSVASAVNVEQRDNATQKGPDSTVRANGPLSNLTMTITQTGTLEATVDMGCSITGDGVPLTVSIGSGPVQVFDHVQLFGQLYESPWVGSATNTYVGTQTSFIPNGAGSHHFTAAFTFTVNVPNEYQAWGMWNAGQSWATTGYLWWDRTQTNYGGYGSAGNVGFASGYVYIDATVPPTATPDPLAGGTPIPTMNRYGILAMIVLLIGVAILVISRRK